jgi:uncharacterized membrane protein
MRTLIMFLRIIHIFGGIFWVGFSIFNIGFLQPAVRATGEGGQSIMGHLTRKTRLLTTVYTSATLTLLSGLIMYWILVGFRASIMFSGYGIVLTTGGIAGIVAWVIAMVTIRGTLNEMMALGGEIQAQGGPPSQEQSDRMQSLTAKLNTAGQVGVLFMLVAVLGMSMAEYSPF